VRTLGLDLGEKWVGVAISDPEQTLAFPLTVIFREGEEKVIEALKELVNQYQVGRIVAGLPRTLRGEIGKEAEKVQTFLKQFSKEVDIPVETWDERFSSSAAERLLVEAGVKSKQRKAHQNALAASFVLQGYLDNQRRTG